MTREEQRADTIRRRAENRAIARTAKAIAAHEERQQRRADRERAEADATARRNGATGIRIG